MQLQLMADTGESVLMTDSPLCYQAEQTAGRPVLWLVVEDRAVDEAQAVDEARAVVKDQASDGLAGSTESAQTVTPAPEFTWEPSAADWQEFLEEFASSVERGQLMVDGAVEAYGLFASYVRLIYDRTYGKPWHVLDTDRLVIRELTERDYRGCQDIFLWSPTEKADLQAAYRREMYEKWNLGIWGIFLKSSGAFLGRAGLEWNPEGELELGYELFAAYRGRGYAYEACLSILDYAGKTLDSPRIVCRIRRGNTASIRLAERLVSTYGNLCMELLYS